MKVNKEFVPEEELTPHRVKEVSQRTFRHGLNALTREEKTLQKTKDEIYNIPQPLYAYLASIGSIVNKMGKRTFLQPPNLPVAVAGGFGGYHRNSVNVDTQFIRRNPKSRCCRGHAHGSSKQC